MKFRFESKDMTHVGEEKIHFRLLEGDDQIVWVFGSILQKNRMNFLANPVLLLFIPVFSQMLKMDLC